MTFEVSGVTWREVTLKWAPTPSSRYFVLREGNLTHYRGRKRKCKVVGLNANTSYTFTLTETRDSGHVVSRDVTFRTTRSGGHDTGLARAIEEHDIVNVRDICGRTRESVNIPDPTGWTPLITASMRGYTSIIRVLVECGANINLPNPGGKTALMLAAYHGHSHVVSTLLHLGADWSVLDKAGCSALHYCMERGNVEVAEALLRGGVDVNLGDSRGYTSLMVLTLSEREDEQMMKCLLHHGADPDLTHNRGGDTVLMAAARTNQTTLVTLLVYSGANTKIKTRFGYTALDMAREESECYRIISENIPEDSDSEY